MIVVCYLLKSHYILKTCTTVRVTGVPSFAYYVIYYYYYAYKVTIGKVTSSNIYVSHN